MRVCGERSRTALIQSAKCPAPPSRRSSRSTLVITTYASFSAATVCARCSGSSGSGGSGRPWPTSQNGQRRVHRSPEDHERRGALAEALADVRAGRFLADRVQLRLAQDLLDLVEPRARARRLDADPVGLRQALRRHDLDRDARGLCRAALLVPQFAHGVGHEGAPIMPRLRTAAASRRQARRPRRAVLPRRPGRRAG